MTLEITVAGRAGDGKSTTAHLIHKLLVECGMVVEHEITEVDPNHQFNFEGLRGKKIKIVERQHRR